MITDENSVKETNNQVDPNDGSIKKEDIKQNEVKEEPKATTTEKVATESDKMKQSEFGYGSIPVSEKPEFVHSNTIPMDWKRQTITSISTSIMSFLPIALKYYNSTKDPNFPKISFDDVSDILIYKFPDLYALVEKLTKGGKLENLVTKGKILKIILPLIPTIKALFKHKENVEKYNFDFMLLAHIVTYAVNTLIPMAMTNKSLNYAYHSFFKGTLSNFTLAALLRSRNPMCREIAKFFLEFTSMFNRAKTVFNVSKNQVNGNIQGGGNGQQAPYMPYTNNQNNKAPVNNPFPNEQVPGKNIIDAISAGLKIFTGGNQNPYAGSGIYYSPDGYNYNYGGRPYYDPYYYDQRRPGGNSIWS